MSLEQQYQNDINKYSALKNKLDSVTSYLSDAMDNVNNLKSNITDNYYVNDNDTPISIRVQKLYNDINSTYNYINNTIYPAIDSSTNSSRQKIAAEQEKEKARERAKEQEKLKQKKKQSTKTKSGGK